MAHLLTERKPYLLLLILLTFNLGLMSSRIKNASEHSLLGEGILSFGSPFLKAAGAIGQGVSGTWNAYVGLRGVEQENRRLREQLDALVLQSHEAAEARQELERLRTLLDLRAGVPFESVPARVIARGVDGGARVVTLDRGAGAGVRINQPVITPRGVVGRIIDAAGGASKVQTILDPNAGVAGLIQRTRVQGMIVGDGDRGCRMEYVSELANVEVGDVVVTSGLDQIYPKGYTLGVIAAIGEGEGLTKIIEIRPEVDFRRLEEVLVLLKPIGPPEKSGP
ncbi:MAG TPA: rod shape-determining protein MreC [Candidatus Polarisedimenticolia bacterium]|jgi:rod shape-determining protein MreC|nr:rod shape-determining protein MreC [Candidatus Polarisedimenticolia bacterium]